MGKKREKEIVNYFKKKHKEKLSMNKMVKWEKPILLKTTFDDVAKHIKVMADSNGPCGSSPGCSCSTACDPLMFYWNCTGHFWMIFG